ncbi:MAG: MraY family glycosyltransferase, partial [bacterium]|nr:MraY family glycosyltransferase [bacterium]
FFDFLPFNSILITQLVTVSWFLLFINSVNFSDGLDGLACGIVAISSFTFLAISVLMWGAQKVLVIQNLKLAAILSAALAGSCIGFLRYNFFPAKIFMGDTGSMFLGYMLAVITTIGTLKTTAVIALFIPMLALGLPLIDITITVWRRWHSKAPLFTSDRQHLHHRLLGKGWTQREVVLLSYVLSGILGIFAILLTIYKGVPH